MAEKYEFPSSGIESEVEDQPKPPPSTSFLIAVGACMIGSFLLVGVIVGQLEAQGATAPATAATPASATPAAEPAPAATPSTTATAEKPAAEEKPAATAASGAVAAEVKTIQSQLDGLSAQIKGIEAKVDTLSKAEPASEVKSIGGKVDELARSVAAVVPVSEKVGQLGGRVDAIEAAIKSFKDEVSGLTAEVKKLSASPAPSAVAAAAAAPSDPKFAEGVDLFKAGKYKEAGDLFKKVESTNPDDARVYYYEAFANALTTNDWKGETLKLAAKAAALEKAGTPRPAVVDEAFADLPSTLKPWLAYFRTQATNP